MWNTPPTPESVYTVARAMKARDWAEFSCISYCADRDSLARSLAERYGSRSDVHVFGDGEDAIAIAGFLELRPGTVSLLFFSTDALPRITTPLTRFVTRTLFPAMREAGAHRFEADSLDVNADTHRWLELLGLRREATMRCYGRDGETFARFAWTKGMADGG